MQQIGILGATGYTGEELLRVLARHSGVQLVFATSEQDAGQTLGQVLPQLPAWQNVVLCSAEQAAERKVDLVFLCLPAKDSAKWADIFLAMGRKVIDLGADFRFRSVRDYERWYGEHPCPQYLQDAVYGLPEWRREEIRQAHIVGNPGCYPTAVLLGILPFAQAGWLNEAEIWVDAKSGLSGAGKGLSKSSHFVEANENTTPYKPGRQHRHTGEIEQELSAFGAKQFRLAFCPHLVPMSRGLQASIYARIPDGISKKECLDLLHSRYAGERFVHVLQNHLPESRMALHSNNAFLALEVLPETGQLMIFSAIDNLGKGASWQAVHNMNLMLQFPEETGLL
jgi:N-acetyl-gamma-glutamyl-phosphate reductase